MSEQGQHGRKNGQRDVPGNSGAVGGDQTEDGAADETEDAGANGSQKGLSQWLLQCCKV
jgi:hypothetical protein